jgi:uncharacterized SAM-binding protein YcdF (DUF218 family)
MFKERILLAISQSLDASIPPKKVRYLFILSGNPVERAISAAGLYRMGLVDTLVCTGEITPEIFKLIDCPLGEEKLTRKILLKEGVDSTRILILSQGTSTYEEALAVKDFLSNRVINFDYGIITSRFHTFRANWIFRKVLTDKADNMRCFAANARNYDINKWWTSEEGLLFVTNEWLKMAYYRYKY